MNLPSRVRIPESPQINAWLVYWHVPLASTQEKRVRSLHPAPEAYLDDRFSHHPYKMIEVGSIPTICTTVEYKMKTYKCLHCKKTNDIKSNKTNKFCNNTCQQEYRLYNETFGRVENNQVRDPGTLKRYLERTRGLNCECCGISNVWNNKPLTLHLDHINGDSDNNFPINLRLLCPNCHSQTDTFAGKKKIRKQTKRNSYLRKYKGYED